MTHQKHHHPVGPAPDQHLPVLDRRRPHRVARDAHAHVRGATRYFYAWLAEIEPGTVPDGPLIWICGNLHMGNVGPLRDVDGNVELQIRDLEQCTTGNPAHDLVRLGLSLSMAARSSDLSGVTTLRMLEQVILGHGEAIRAVIERATRRRWKHLTRERLDHVEPHIPIGKHFWTLSGQERVAIDRLVALEAARTMIGELQGHGAGAEISVLDAACWRKGCSSLGKLRYVVMGRRRIQPQASAPSSARPEGGGGQRRAADARHHVPSDPAEHVVAPARALSPNLGAHMLAAHLLDRPIVVRELMQQDLKLEITRLTPDEAIGAAGFLANVVEKPTRARCRPGSVDSGLRR